jgi:hypothetical protein
LEPSVPLQPMEFSVEIGFLERAGRGKSRPLDGVFVAIAAFETGRSADTLRFALASRKIGCAGPNDFVACPSMQGRVDVWLGRRVRTSWSLGPLRGKLADEQLKARAAARADARSVDPFRIGGVRAHLGSMWRRLTVEEK